MSIVVYLLLCAIYNEQLELIEFLFSSYDTLWTPPTDHEAVVVPKPLQVCIHCRAGQSNLTLVRQS